MARRVMGPDLRLTEARAPELSLQLPLTLNYKTESPIIQSHASKPPSAAPHLHLG